MKRKKLREAPRLEGDYQLMSKFLADAPDHIWDGFIKLRPRAVTIPGLMPDRWTGDTRHDKELLRSFINRSTFPMEDYDNVLGIVGRIGFGFETPWDLEEPEKPIRRTKLAGSHSLLAPVADCIVEWLTSLKHKDARPCIVTIDGVDWASADYLFSDEFTANMMGVTHGKKKVGDPFRERRLYCVGKLPQSKRNRNRTCYLWGPQTWYISGYYRNDSLPPGWRKLSPEDEKRIHPWGEHFMMGQWDCKESIDAYEDHPYTRVPMAVTYLK